MAKKIDIKKEMLKNPLIRKKVLDDIKTRDANYYLEYHFTITKDDIFESLKEQCDDLTKEMKNLWKRK